MGDDMQIKVFTGSIQGLKTLESAANKFAEGVNVSSMSVNIVDGRILMTVTYSTKAVTVSKPRKK